MTDLDDALRLEPRDALRWELTIPEDWMQGRTAFGGLVAAAAVRAVRTALGAQCPLRSLHTAYLAPVAAGTAALAVEVLRQGRYVTQAEVRVLQAGAVVACVHAVLGERRASSLRIARGDASAPFTPEDGLEIPFLPGVTPTFTQHFEYRLAAGGIPFSGSSDARLQGHCRHRTRASGVEAVIALLDAWPTPALNLASRPIPASTVRWTAHLVGDPDAAPADGWWRYQAEALTCGDGYSTTFAQLFAGPELVAWMEQLVAVFDG
jgi:acyl-CoA thioesterase